MGLGAGTNGLRDQFRPNRISNFSQDEVWSSAKSASVDMTRPNDSAISLVRFSSLNRAADGANASGPAINPIRNKKVAVGIHRDCFGYQICRARRTTISRR